MNDYRFLLDEPEDSESLVDDSRRLERTSRDEIEVETTVRGSHARGGAIIFGAGGAMLAAALGGPIAWLAIVGGAIGGWAAGRRVSHDIARNIEREIPEVKRHSYGVASKILERNDDAQVSVTKYDVGGFTPIGGLLFGDNVTIVRNYHRKRD
jgi:hypothetical protein